MLVRVLSQRRFSEVKAAPVRCGPSVRQDQGAHVPVKLELVNAEAAAERVPRLDIGHINRAGRAGLFGDGMAKRFNRGHEPGASVFLHQHGLEPQAFAFDHTQAVDGAEVVFAVAVQH